MVRLLTVALLCALFILASCSGVGISHSSTAQGGGQGFEVQTACDAPEAGPGCTMRFHVVDHAMESAEWKIAGKTYTSTKENGAVYVNFDHPGSVVATFRGVDKEGRDCTGPRGGVKFSVRKGANAGPIVADFGGPVHLGRGGGFFEIYEIFRWDAEFYDPEGDAFQAAWDVCAGDDTDGDGLPDEVLFGKTATGELFHNSGHGRAVNPDGRGGSVDSQNQFAVWAYELLGGGARYDARVVVTLTQGSSSRKWGDGHVTLMK